MRIGLHALGIGTGARPGVITAVAGAAESGGLATLWAGEHVVMVEGPDARYPYAADGRIAVPADADWLDPWIVLTLAAASTSRIAVATGVLLLPEHNPLVTAKRAASLDAVSGGRLRLGVGIGWSSAEFAALGVPFADRARRTEEYVAAMRALWREEVASFAGDFTRFANVRCHPKPARPIPVVLGGNSDAALERVADYGDGWYGFNLAVDEVAGRLDALRAHAGARGRAPGSLDLAVSLSDGRPEDLGRLADWGVDEVVLVASPPADPSQVAPWLGALVGPWMAALSEA
jgi:probable F420-dependent oxidoreductase